MICTLVLIGEKVLSFRYQRKVISNTCASVQKELVMCKSNLGTEDSCRERTCIDLQTRRRRRKGVAIAGQQFTTAAGRWRTAHIQKQPLAAKERCLLHAHVIPFQFFTGCARETDAVLC
jgi:hypothetical protein